MLMKIEVIDISEEPTIYTKNVLGRLWFTAFNGTDWYTVGKYCHHVYAHGECSYCRLVLEDESNDEFENCD